MPISDQFTSAYKQSWEVNFSQCTPAGLLKYTELCNMLQLTAASHAELGGISFTDMQAANQAWVLSRMRLEINGLPRWRDVVTVSTWIISLENYRSIRALEVHCGEEKLVGCETSWAVFNTNTRRPEHLALPHDHFKKYTDKHATISRVKKVDASNTEHVANTRTVAVSDLDMVNHVNNVKYLEWCLDLIQPEVVLESKIIAMDMNFARELLLRDEIEISRASEGHQHTFSVTRQSQKCFTLQLSTALY